jgi:predicted RND superfamily exporter protein
MSSTRHAIESRFQSLGLLLYRNPRVSLAFALALIGASSYRLPDIAYDSSNDALLHDTDPHRLAYDAFQDRFGGSELVVIGIEAPEIFDAGFLAKLESFHHQLEEELPNVREITSLINARSTRGEADVLKVGGLLEDWRSREIDADALRASVLSNPVYLNHLISPDGGYTAVVITTQASEAEVTAEEALLAGFEEEPLESSDESRRSQRLSDDQNREIFQVINRVAERHRGPGFALSIAGGPVIYQALSSAQRRDTIVSVSLMVPIIAFLLAAMFRRASGILIPELVVSSATLSTFGVMAWLGVPIKPPTTILPGFVLAVGVADSVHILAIFYRRLDRGAPKEEALVHAIGHSGLPVVMTTLTTAAGLLSFSFAKLVAIAEVGIFCALGVSLALLYTILVIPPVVALTPIRPARVTEDRPHPRPMDLLLLSIADLATSHPRRILAAGLALFIASAAFIPQLRFSHDMVEWFPETSVLSRDVKRIDHELNGTIPLEVVLDTGEVDGVLDPAVLLRIEEVSRRLREDPALRVGKIFSINDILKETNQALHGNDHRYYSVPRDRALVAQQLLLFENSGSDDLEKLVDGEYRRARITLKMPWDDAVEFAALMERVEGAIRRSFGEEANFSLTGMMSLMARTVPAALHSMATSYLAAGLVISLMMILMLGSIGLGLISMIPNLLPILAVLGVMGFAGVALDFVTLMLFSIAIGIVVDDTVHFMYNFRRYYEASGDACEAVRQTFLGTGRALLVTSLLMTAGFSTLMFASLASLNRMGLFTALAILLALAADFLMAPALMVLIAKRAGVSTELRSPAAADGSLR